MKGLKQFSPGLRRIIKKMCSIVRANPEKIDFKKDGWYSKHTWTHKQNDAFKKWFIDLLCKNSKLCRELYGHRAWNRKWASEAYSWFNLQYGWKNADLKDK